MDQLHKAKEIIKDHFKRVNQSHLLIKVIYGICILIVLAVVFRAGEFVGFHKAEFGRNWRNHYEKNFGPRPPGPFGAMSEQFPNGHGTIGKIVKVELPNVIVIDRDNTEKVVIINNDTDIVLMREKIANIDIKVGDQIVVIGSPNESGQIVAKLIRILPSELNGPEITSPRQQ